MPGLSMGMEFIPWDGTVDLKIIPVPLQ